MSEKNDITARIEELMETAYPKVEDPTEETVEFELPDGPFVLVTKGSSGVYGDDSLYLASRGVQVIEVDEAYIDTFDWNTIKDVDRSEREAIQNRAILSVADHLSVNGDDLRREIDGAFEDELFEDSRNDIRAWEAEDLDWDD